MRKSLLFIAGTAIILFNGSGHLLNGQTVLFSEDFSGFTAGTHVTPSTSDVSSSLDAKTSVPGWNGSMIYPAGGEIKVGTSVSAGWIETPLIDLSASQTNFIIRFDIARWPGDANTVQVYVNDIETGDVLTPTDNFQTIQLVCNEIISSGRIKIKGLTKRFYIDNFSILAGNVPVSASGIYIQKQDIKVYPVPASTEINISCIKNYDLVEIIDFSGRITRKIVPDEMKEIRVDIGGLEDGTYFLRFTSGKYFIIKRFLKLQN